LSASPRHSEGAHRLVEGLQQNIQVGNGLNNPVRGNPMRRNLFYICLLVLWMLCLVVIEVQAEVLVTKAEVETVVRDFVWDRVSGFDGEVTVSVRHLRDIRVAGTGPVALRVRPNQGRDRRGSVSGVMEIRRGPVCVAQHLVSADVKFFADVAVADREIRRNESMTVDAIRFERLEVTGRMGRYIGSVSELTGLRSRSRISAGRIVDPMLLEETPAVERRDRVRIKVVIGTVRAFAAGMATESGVVGDRIIVQNLDSREKLLAEVVAPGVVQAVF